MTARGIDLSYALERTAPNRHAVILVDETSGARSVVWHRDARLALAASELPRDAIAAARLLHVDDLDLDASIAAARVAARAGIPVTADIDRVDERTMELVGATSAPMFSSHVPEALTGERDPERALRKLGRGRHGLLVVTLGDKGATLLDGDRLHIAEAVPVQAVDTTGAGDVFRGAFIYALLRGSGPEDILRFAVTAAAVSCTRAGAMDAVPELAEIEALTARAPR
jgi:sugar/nucleoside kinase (ribokinase family)